MYDTAKRQFISFIRQTWLTKQNDQKITYQEQRGELLHLLLLGQFQLSNYWKKIENVFPEVGL